MVFRLIYLLFNNLEITIITALLFGIHTLQVESVAWASAQKVVLYSMFFLASLISYVSYVKEDKMKYLYFSLLFFLLSFLSKEQAVILPATLIAIDFLLGRKLLSKKVIAEKIPFMVLSLIFCAVSYFAFKTAGGSTSSFPSHPFYKQFLFACYGFTQYLFKLIIPFQLSAYYPYPETGGMINFIYLLIVIGIIAGFIYSLKHSRQVAFGIMFFVINIILVLQIVPLRETIIADRYIYLPSIGFFIVIATGYTAISKYKFVYEQKNLKWVIVTVYLLFLGVSTYNRCGVWKDSMTLWDDVILKYPDSPTPLCNRGITRVNLNDYKGAIEDLDKAIMKNPALSKAYNNRGIAKGALGNFKEALNDFEKAIQINSTYGEAYANRGIAKINLGYVSEAVDDFSMQIKLNPNAGEAYFMRGNARFQLNDKQGACNDWQKAHQLKIPRVAEMIQQYCNPQIQPIR